MTTTNETLCPMCAEGIRGNEINCPHCGSTARDPASFAQLKNDARPTAARPGAKKLGVILGVAVVIAAGGIVAGVVISHPGENPAQSAGRAADAPPSPVEKTVPVGEADATPEALKNVAYHFSIMGDGDETIILKDGKYSEDGGATVTLAPKHQQVADVDGDGLKEAIGILEYGIGASSIYGVLVVVDGPDSNPKQKAAAVLGDRELIERVQPAGDTITLDMVVHTESDPECCPSHRTTLRYQLRGNDLIADTNAAAGGGGPGNASDFLSGLPHPSDPVTDAAGARGHLKKGRLLERDGQHDAAIAEYVEALRLSPTMPTRGKEGAVWGELGYALMNAERYDDAEFVCKRALDVGGDGKFRSSVNYNMGAIAVKGGRTQDAIHYFEAAVAANPDNKVAAAKLAELRGN